MRLRQKRAIETNIIPQGAFVVRGGSSGWNTFRLADKFHHLGDAIEIFQIPHPLDEQVTRFPFEHRSRHYLKSFN